MQNTRLLGAALGAGLILLAGGCTRKEAQAQPRPSTSATAAAKPTDVTAQPAAQPTAEAKWVVIDAKDDPLFQLLQTRFKGSLPTPPIRAAKKAIEKALPLLQKKAPGGVTLPKELACSRDGCMGVVRYEEVDGIKKFDPEASFPDPKKFNLRFGHGRTGVLRDEDGKHIVAWFFLGKHGTKKFANKPSDVETP